MANTSAQGSWHSLQQGDGTVGKPPRGKPDGNPPCSAFADAQCAGIPAASLRKHARVLLHWLGDELLPAQTPPVRAAGCHCRVHTMALPVVGDLVELYKGSDAGATAALLAKMSVERSYAAKLDDVRMGVRKGGGAREPGDYSAADLPQLPKASQMQPCLKMHLRWSEGRHALWWAGCAGALHAHAASPLTRFPGYPDGQVRASCWAAHAVLTLVGCWVQIQQRLVAGLREYRLLHMRGQGIGVSPNSMVLPDRLKSLPVLCLGEWRPRPLSPTGLALHVQRATACPSRPPTSHPHIHPACSPGATMSRSAPLVLTGAGVALVFQGKYPSAPPALAVQLVPPCHCCPGTQHIHGEGPEDGPAVP